MFEQNFKIFMYKIYQKKWGDDIMNSRIHIFISTVQEIFCENLRDFTIS